MKFIALTIKCHASIVPEGLEDVVESEKEWREGRVNTEHIAAFYPSLTDGETCLDLVSGEGFTIKESVEEIQRRIDG